MGNLCIAIISNHIYVQRKAILQAIRSEGYRKMVRRDFKLEDIFKDKEVRTN